MSFIYGAPREILGPVSYTNPTSGIKRTWTYRNAVPVQRNGSGIRRGYNRSRILTAARRRRQGPFHLNAGVKSGGPQTYLRLPYGYGMADRYECNDQVCYQTQSTSVTGKQDYLFYANSVWHVDPATTDCRNYARFSAIYRKSTVVSSAIRVTLVNADSTHPVHLTVTPSADTACTTEELASTNNLSKATICTQYAGKEIVHHYVNIKKLVGKNYNDDNYSAGLGAHPANNVYWHVQLWGDVAGETALNCHLYVWITQHIIWSDRETN